MKIRILIALLLSSSSAVAQHPRDFVPDDALAVVSFKNGDAINATLQSITEQSGLPSAAPNVIELSEYFENPSVVDLASEVLIILVPTKLEAGQKSGGMMGTTPHMMVICKAREGSSLALTKTSGLKTSTTIDGWFVATAASKWTPRSAGGLSPIFAKLPNAQFAGVVKFGTLWKQFGPMIQMVGGMGIGSLNKPGPDGVIPPEKKKATAVASKGFKELTKWCSTVQDITVGINFDKYTLIAEINVNMKEGKNLSIDNSSLIEVSKLLSDNMFQYAMSGKLTRKLMDMDLESLRNLAPGTDSFPTIMTSKMKALIDTTGDNIVSYSLDTQNGLTFASITDVSDQGQYLTDLAGVVSEFKGMLQTEFNMELSIDAPLTWDVKMLGSDDEETSLMTAIIHEGDRLRLSKYGKNRILMAFGPTEWRPLGQARMTPLSEVMSGYKETLDIDFAGTFDARSLFVSVTKIVRIVDPKRNAAIIGKTPSARSSLIFGTTKSGTLIEIKSDLLGIATLVAELDN